MKGFEICGVLSTHPFPYEHLIDIVPLDKIPSPDTVSEDHYLIINSNVNDESPQNGHWFVLMRTSFGFEIFNSLVRLNLVCFFSNVNWSKF